MEIHTSVFPKRIFFTEDDWCRISWIRLGVQNISVYEFKPSRKKSDGTGGFLGEFTRQMAADPLLKYRYLYRTISQPKQLEEA